MEIVKVLGRDIIVSSGITELITKELSAYKSSTLVVVTDENVAALHLQPLLAGLHSKRVLSYIMPSGEVHKTRETKAAIEDYMLSNNCTRDSVIVALGGGVVGDLAGVFG
jgi:pentafunctional AROM polypeptide